MRAAVKWVVVTVLVLHGLLHLLGAAKGFGWAEVSQLTVPVGPAMGATWLWAGALVIAAGMLLAVGFPSFWAVGALAVVASQAMIFTSWRDAQAGSLANVILLAAVIVGYTAWRRRATSPRRNRGAVGAVG